MKLAAIAICTTLFPFFACAQVTNGTCERAFETDFPPGGEIRMHIRSGDIEVIGSDARMIKITCEIKNRPDRAKDVRITFKPAGNAGDLRVSGGPNSEFRIRIEVPRNTHLWVRSPAGDLTLKDMIGDKDVELHAGNLDIAVGEPSDYAHAHGSVNVGDLTASAFGVRKGGFFRSFKKENPGGKYRLHAHVGAGDLVLR